MTSPLDKYTDQFRYKVLLVLPLVLFPCLLLLAMWLHVSGSAVPDPSTGRTFPYWERGVTYVDPAYGIAFYVLFVGIFSCIGIFAIINRKTLAVMVSETSVPGGRGRRR